MGNLSFWEVCVGEVTMATSGHSPERAHNDPPSVNIAHSGRNMRRVDRHVSPER